MAHDTSACILQDGNLLVFIEEERLNREKHTAKYPFLAIQACLDYASLTYDEIDVVAYGHKLPPQDFLTNRQGKLSVESVAELGWWSQLYEKSLHAHTLFGPQSEVIHVGHHEAHASSAFFASPFDKAVILSIDGAGDDLSTLLAVGQGKNIEVIDRIYYPHSLGRLWAVITHYLGYSLHTDEGKVMALAAFGDAERYKSHFRKLIRVDDNGLFSLDLNYFDFYRFPPVWIVPKLIELLGKPRKPQEPLQQHHFDIASALQTITEEIIVKMVNHLIRTTKIHCVCLAGGVALNCMANSKLLKETPAQKLFVQPATGDAGTALGAALWEYFHLPASTRSWNMKHAYWGPGFNENEVEKFLLRSKQPFHRVPEPHTLAARLLTEGRIVGWIQGRSEVGPRALGNRSILCDPRSHSVKDYINGLVKGRESFRPFAPVVINNKADVYFELQNGNMAYEYMLSACNVRPNYRESIPGVVHVDGTARVQLTSTEANPPLADLINEFGRLTGTYVLLNTSFNLSGEPIVQTIKDAYRSFCSSGMDDIIIGHHWVTKHHRLGDHEEIKGNHPTHISE